MKCSHIIITLLLIPAIAHAQAPIAHYPTETQAADGTYIAWHETPIDTIQISPDAPISGSDGLVIADLDADGYPDIVTVHEADTTYDGKPTGLVRIAYGSQDPNQWTLRTLAEGPEAAAAEDAAIGDINNDGLPDIIVANELAHLIYFQNPGTDIRNATWPRVIPNITKNRGSYIRVFLADLDHDGQLEAIAPNKGEQNPEGNHPKKPISIYSIKGDPLDPDGWTETVLGEYLIPQNSQPIDLDADGDLDIIGGSRGENRIFWFENKSTPGALSFIEHPILADGTNTGGFNMDYADLNHDGRLDIIAPASLAIGPGLIWLQQPESPDKPWPSHEIGNIAPDLLVGLALADIDGDQHLDIMTGSYSRGARDQDDPNAELLGRIAWFQNPGDPAQPWTRHDITRRIRGMFDKFIPRDHNQDGHIDFHYTRGNSHPHDGLYTLTQRRTETPTQRFTTDLQQDSKQVPLPQQSTQRFTTAQHHQKAEWTQWYRPADNPVFTTQHGNNHDSILFIDHTLEYPYHLIISHEKEAAHLWRTKNVHWSSDHWELVTDQYIIAPHYEFDDGIKIDDTYYIYEGGIVYTYTGPLEEASGKWTAAGTFPKDQCDDAGVWYEDGTFHLFGEYGDFPHGPDGTSLAHFTSKTGLGDWTLINPKAVDPNPDGGNHYGVGDPTITKIDGQYYLFCDRESPGSPYKVIAWTTPDLYTPFQYLGIALKPRSNETDDWDNHRIQDADIGYIPELNRFIMTVNMNDHDGNPGGHFPTLPKKQTRVIGTFYSTNTFPPIQQD